MPHQPEDQHVPVELLQSPRQGKASEGCSKVWIVSLSPPLYLDLPTGVVLKLQGVITSSGLQFYSLPTSTATRGQYQARRQSVSKALTFPSLCFSRARPAHIQMTV